MRPSDLEMTAQPSDAVLGLVLAAGAGTRFGGPKALARDRGGVPWVVRAVRALHAGGCGRVLVALGASAEEARDLVPPDAEIVVVPDWQLGLSVTISRGLAAASERSASAVVILPVDTPDAPPAVVRRVIAAAADAPRRALVQATYGGDPGHPVLIGAEHFAPLSRALSGDRGARAYLATHETLELPCEDLWSGDDIDTRPLDGD